MVFELPIRSTYISNPKFSFCDRFGEKLLFLRLAETWAFVALILIFCFILNGWLNPDNLFPFPSHFLNPSPSLFLFRFLLFAMASSSFFPFIEGNIPLVSVNSINIHDFVEGINVQEQYRLIYLRSAFEVWGNAPMKPLNIGMKKTELSYGRYMSTRHFMVSPWETLPLGLKMMSTKQRQRVLSWPLDYFLWMSGRPICWFVY